MLRKISVILVLCLLVWPLAAQTKFEFWPGATYDPAVPTFKKVLGYEPGEHISSHAQLMQYLNALAAAVPSQMKVFEFGQSWEGRKFVYAAIGSPANIKRLAEIRAGMQALADPRKTPDAEARKLIASLPAVVFLAYGIHGNEISSPDAALLTAYHLLAARKDPVVDSILKDALVLIEPSQNPDGRDRFVRNYDESYGIEPDPNPAAAEHSENWPGGRGNHYLFDCNRDWFAQTQPEVRGQIKVLQEWYPQVFVDAHEMGADSTYYFAPPADPFNPNITADQKDTLNLFGKNNAKWFDKFGFDYFTRDEFDAFYPGYGDSWPPYLGGVGMTFEQASARGLVMRRQDDTLLPFRNTVRQHFVASISTAEAAALNRQKLLERFYNYRKSAIEEGSKGPIREYILVREGDTSAVDKLAAVLSEQGIEMKRATASFKAAGREMPAGSYVIPLAQPSERLARTLLDSKIALDDKFVKEMERRRKKKLSDDVYDITAWSLPLAYNVEAVPANEVSQGNFEPAKPQRIPPGKFTADPKALAYISPGGTTATGRLMAAALHDNLHVLANDRPFTQNGTKYAAGSLIFKVHDNPADLPKKLEELAKTTGAEIRAVDSSWVDDGPNFGDRYVAELKKPAILLVWDRPTSSASAGAARFVLERQFGYPVSVVRAAQIGMADLSKYNVIILPEGNGYFETFGANGTRRLQDWVQNGGTLVGLGSAMSYLIDPRVGFVSASLETAARPAEAAKPGASGAARQAESPKPVAGAPGAPAAGGPQAAGAAGQAPAGPARVPGKLIASEEEYQKAIQPDTDMPDRVLGVMLKAQLDPDHWLTAGLPPAVYALVSGRSVYTPVKLDKGVNAAVFAGPDQLVASGYMWEENRKQFAYKPLVIVQPDRRGQVIAFTSDPNFRAFIDGMNMIFVNAVFRGPAHARAGGRGGEE
jgi:hypothetical protein